ncbi:type IV pilus modification PilV family protein [Trinickia mobilis]|uniref:type IV pilus modification PilV family protein n=1 Tax=Trinickia mobilis TaxID=2816356 RepID=UPI001A8F53E8|nr:prepilin-type N-terminal cleavage/methylation domain-containing protein [Trinickia mobilis]
MKARWWRKGRGTTLLEVLVAVALMAVSALGVISAQLWLARGESELAMREGAVLIADSLAEAARNFTPESVALEQWRTQAASILPSAELSVREQGGRLALSVVRWAAWRRDSRVPFHRPVACDEAAVSSASLSCASIAFVR